MDFANPFMRFQNKEMDFRNAFMPLQNKEWTWKLINAFTKRIMDFGNA